MADDFGYHIDQHGSLVRPPVLQAARTSGEPLSLAAAQEQAAVAAAHAQRRLALSACGDGQFRREHFESVVYDRVAGFSPATGAAPLAELAGIPADRRRLAPHEAVAQGRLAQAEAAPVLATVDRPVFVTLPSPGYLAALGSPLTAPSDIDAVRARGDALAPILRAEIAALAGDGVAYVALGNSLYVPLLTVDGRAALSAAAIDADGVLAAMVEADRSVFAGLAVPPDFRVGLDLTDSGPLPTTSSGYSPAALETLLEETPFQRLCVDFPACPAARMPIELVKPGLVVSLGVVDVSSRQLESVEALLERLDPVLDQRGESDVALATNGGFAQSADSPLVTEELQNAKLRLVEMTARYYWGNEI